MQRTARIALTGGIGSGKSTLARLLVAQGAGLVDSDAIARELTAAGGAALDAIRAQFGAEYIGEDGALDRARMRDAVFADALRRRQLEALLHPMISQRTEQLARALAPTVPYLIFDIPLLAEGGSADGRFDRILVTDCPVPTQIERVMARGTLRRAEVEAIIAGQADRRRRLEIADDVVFNSAGLDHLERSAHRLHGMYRSMRSALSSV
jgi:dephospho-CoA kinase